MSGPLILVVDDDPGIRRFLQAQLRAHDFRVAVAADGEAALEMAGDQPPDAVILDLGLPRLSGVATLRQFREWSSAPVLVLSALDDQPKKVEALDEGADDYVTKPFGMEELLARLRAALRRARSTAGEGDPLLQIGPIAIDQARHRVAVAGSEVRLTRTEYELLRVLAINAGKVLTHRQILERVWGPEYHDDSDSLRTFIKQLRRKIEPDPIHARFIRTVPGVGYCFERDER